ncbi:hypothetical protein K7432_015887 [Basidiobolus ranarum]|uniref:Cleavage stimulation factor subunit 2 hinge domain-containing protein n=1 Tax=Basidiobolus ranarum TaxID=34480 RepID=A0ABR2VNJ2_9FUNG
MSYGFCLIENSSNHSGHERVVFGSYGITEELMHSYQFFSCIFFSILNNYEVGGRQLRVNHAESDSTNNAEGYRISEGDVLSSGSDPRLSGQAGGRPQVSTSTESVSNAISSMNTNQLAELMVQMKAIAQQSPEQARSVLTTNPQLAYGIFQAMLTMNLVDHKILQRLLNRSPNQTQAINTPVAPASNYSGPPESVPNVPLPTPMAQSIPPAPSAPISSVDNIGATAPPAMNDSLQEQQRVLLMQLLSLTPQQIDSLPPDQRQHILQLKAQIMMGQGQT